jgi:hypothetical protein
MIDQNVKEQLDGARSTEEVQSLMLQWTETPDSSLFASAQDKRGRLQLLQDFYRSRKQSALRVLEGEEGIQVRDLPNSGSVILTGPVAKLQQLIRRGSLLERAERIQVLPNVQFHSLTGAH